MFILSLLNLFARVVLDFPCKELSPFCISPLSDIALRQIAADSSVLFVQALNLLSYTFDVNVWLVRLFLEENFSPWLLSFLKTLSWKTFSSSYGVTPFLSNKRSFSFIFTIFFFFTTILFPLIFVCDHRAFWKEPMRSGLLARHLRTHEHCDHHRSTQKSRLASGSVFALTHEDVVPPSCKYCRSWLHHACLSLLNLCSAYPYWMSP